MTLSNPQRTQSPDTREGRSRPISAASSARAAASVTKLGAVIVELLTRDGPMHTPGICRALERDYSATVPIMAALVKIGAVRIAGKASQLGFSDVKSSAPVYAATGVSVSVKENKRGRPEIPTEMPPPHNERRRDAKPRTKAGSGVIAGRIEIGRGYNWKAGFV